MYQHSGQVVVVVVLIVWRCRENALESFLLGVGGGGGWNGGGWISVFKTHRTFLADFHQQRYLCKYKTRWIYCSNLCGLTQALPGTKAPLWSGSGAVQVRIGGGASITRVLCAKTWGNARQAKRAPSSEDSGLGVTSAFACDMRVTHTYTWDVDIPRMCGLSQCAYVKVVMRLCDWRTGQLGCKLFNLDVWITVEVVWCSRTTHIPVYFKSSTCLYMCNITSLEYSRYWVFWYSGLSSRLVA